MTEQMTPAEMRECKGRWPHNWHVRRFGGVGCGRCGAESARFSMRNGRPEVRDES